MPPTSRFSALGQVGLTVSDVARSTEFYRDVLGLPFLFSAGPSLAFLDLAGVRLMLTRGEGAFTPGSSTVLYLKTDDIRAVHAELGGRGADLVDEPHLVAPMPDHDLWMCFVRDPDGHTIGIMSEREKGAV